MIHQFFEAMKQTRWISWKDGTRNSEQNLFVTQWVEYQKIGKISSYAEKCFF